MEATCQLLKSCNVVSELIDGQNRRSLTSSSFQKSDTQVPKVSVGGRQLQHSHRYAFSFSEGLRGERHQYLPPARVARVSRNVSGEVESYEWLHLWTTCGSTHHLWKKYFSDPSQFWDNTINKRKYRAPDFQHKVTGEALWIDNPSTPQWVKPLLLEVAQGSSGVRDLERPSQFMPGKHLRNASTTSEAIAIVKNHLQQGIAINSYMYVDVLQRCFKQKDLASAKQVHDCITKSGMEQNPYVANKLLRVYIKCGRLLDARQVFDKLVKKNVVHWTTMIGGYAEHDRAADAIKVYNQMRQEGAQPNEVTYLSILKACASPVAFKWAKEVHAHIKHGGFQSNVRVQTTLVNMYAKSGNIGDARLVFDKMVERNVVTWNAMIGGLAQNGCGQEALTLFLQMQKEGFVPDATTYLNILTACALDRQSSAGALEWVKEVHRHAVKAGLDSDLRVGNALVHMYAKSSSINNARLVFERMVDRDVISWSAMIGGLAQNGCGQEAFTLFLQMQKEGIIPNVTTYVSILGASASSGSLEWVKQVHNHAIKAGLGSNLRVGNALVHMYARSGSIDDARQVFNGMVNRNVITWNVMIGALAKHGCGQEAFSLFLQMHREGFVPDAITYLSILNASASVGALEWVKVVHSYAIKAGLDFDLRVSNALVHMYAMSGSIDDARLVFDGMVDRDLITWTAMIGGLARNECGEEAFSLFLRMQKKGFVPVATTYESILNACGALG